MGKYIATNHDVTDPQRLLAAIVENSEDAIISSTLAGVILTWNRGAEAIFGYKAGDALGNHLSMLMAPDRLPDLAYCVGQISQGFTVSQYRSLCRRKDGRKFRASVTGAPLINSAGEVEGLSAILRDISKQKDSSGADTTPAPGKFSGEPSKATFDGEGLLRRLMGDQRLARSVIGRFLEGAPDRFDQLRMRLAAADALGAKALAHALKGSAATVAAEGLRAIAQAIEREGNAGRLDQCRELLPQVVEEFERFKNTLQLAGWIETQEDQSGCTRTKSDD